MKKPIHTLLSMYTIWALSPIYVSTAANYIVTDIGTLGGDYSIAEAINESAVVAGRSRPPDSAFFRAYVWDNGNGLQYLAPLPGYVESQAIGLNNFGQVVGNMKQDPFSGYLPFVWEQTTGFVVMGDHATAFAINDQGQVVGQATALCSDYCAFLWDKDNGMRRLGTLEGSNYSGARNLNKHGAVVGYSFFASSGNQAWIWDETSGMLPIGGGAMEANDINEKGHVVGRMRSANGNAHAFFWGGAHDPIDLGTLEGRTHSSAYAINDLGLAVGGSSDGFGNGQAFVFVEGEMLNLNDLISQPGNWFLERATDINNRGQIVGVGQLHGVRHSFMLTPIPMSTGDFDGDGNLTCNDVNALSHQIATSSIDMLFDLTSDGLINLDDLDEWLAIAGAANVPSGQPYLLADANLDGAVDVTDYNIWHDNRWTVNTEYCSGDFNANGAIDVSDFNIWFGNKFQSAGVTVVPEPSGVAVVWVFVAVFAMLSQLPTHTPDARWMRWCIADNGGQPHGQLGPASSFPYCPT